MLMRKLLSLFILASAAASASNPNDWKVGGEHENIRAEIKQTPEKSGGIYYAYSVTTDELPAAAMKYHPIAIVHYGRHGSRWAIKERQYDIADSLFTVLDNRGVLTPLGKDIKKRLQTIGAHARGHAGELSPMGERQHKAIARRMVGRFFPLFSRSKTIEARSSVEPRCIISMAAFSEQLKELMPGLTIGRHATPGDMDFIAYSTTEAKASGKLTAPWRKNKNRFIDSVLDPTRFLSALVTDTTGISPQQGRQAMQLLHDIAIAVQDVDGLGDIQLWDVFTDDEIFNLWQIINYEMYFRHASASGNGNHGKRSATSLLSHIIATADSAIAGTAPAINLHFGHDTNLIRLLALMGVDGCDNAESDVRKYADAWQGFRVSPMAANLQLVLYRGTDGRILALIRHNEQTATVQLPQAEPGLYDWNQLKTYWQQRIETINHA